MQLRGTAIVVDTVASKIPVISGSGTTRVLNEYESGSVVLLDRVAGTIFTLPDAKPGMTYKFVSTANLTGSSFQIKATAASQSYVLIGQIRGMLNNATTGTPVFQATEPPGTTYQQIHLNAGTTGGRIGSEVTVTAVSKGTWFVQGVTVGTTTVTMSTPFLA